jgi:ABC-type transporter Mla subunit MlaD
MDELLKHGGDLAKELRTPWEKLADTMDDLHALLNVAAIDMTTYQRAVAKAADEFEKATEEKEKFDKALSATPGVGAVQAGTSAGFSAVQAAARQQEDTQRRQLEVEQQQLQQQQKANEIAARIENLLHAGGGPQFIPAAVL